jgi:hypothetical protein
MKIKHIYLVLAVIMGSHGISLGQGKGPIIDGIIAKVDNYIILRSELEEATNEYMQQFRLSRRDATCEALRTLILNKVMVAKAEIDSVLVEDDVVERDLNMRMQYFISQFGSQARLEQHYNKTMEQFKEELRGPLKEQLVANKMRGEITGKVKVTPAEVKRFFDRIPADSLPFYSKEVTVGQIVKIPSIGQSQKENARRRANEIRDMILKGNDLTNEYRGWSIQLNQDNNVRITTPGGNYSGTWMFESNNIISIEIESDNPLVARLNDSWLVTRRGNSNSEINLINSDFNDNTTFVLSTQNQQAALVISRNNLVRNWTLTSASEGGADFAEVARTHSDDPGSAQNGGNLGFHRRGELVPSYEATAMNLRPGEISQPVESQFGFHVIQLLERRGNEYNSRHILVRFNSSELDISTAKNYLDSLRTNILNDSISFEKAAKEYSDDKVTAASGGFYLDESTGANSISVEDIDPMLFFTLDTMQVGSISPPLEFRMEDGKTAVRIIYYKNYIPPHKANLRDDYQKIQVAALNQKRQKALFDWFEDAKKEVFIDIVDQYNSCNILDAYGTVRSDTGY